jgi:hypothetical protein
MYRPAAAAAQRRGRTRGSTFGALLVVTRQHVRPRPGEYQGFRWGFPKQLTVVLREIAEVPKAMVEGNGLDQGSL